MLKKIKKAGASIAEHRVKIVTTFVCLLLCAANIFTTVSGVNTVKIYYNGKAHEISTYRTTADDVIAQSGLDIDLENSYVDTSMFEEYGVIMIDSLVHITVVDEGTSYDVSGHGTIGDILTVNNISLGDHDVLKGADKSDYANDGDIIYISRAFSVMISADGDITTIYMTEGTVADALDLAVITADDDDLISKPLDTVLTGNTSIKITRIEYKERKDAQVIKYTTKTENTNTLNVGQSKVKQAGVNGEKVLTYEDKYIDGKLAESTLKKTEITKEAVEEIKLVGTKRVAAAAATAKQESSGTAAKTASGVATISTFAPPASLQLTSSNTPTSYKRKIVGTATAYHCGTHTSTGKAVRPGYVAVNPNQIPYHTAMWIISNDGRYVYGYCFAEDTGGFIYFTGRKKTLCDLYMPSESMCNQFGRRSVTIYIL